MKPWFFELTRILDGSPGRAQLSEVLSRLEDNYDGFDAMEQEIAGQLLERVTARLKALDDTPPS